MGRYLIALALILATHAGAYVKGRFDGAATVEADAERAEDRQEASADVAAQSHEATKAEIRTELKTIYREVPRVVEKPIYRNVCLDADGLRLVREAIGSGAPREPAPAVPGSD